MCAERTDPQGFARQLSTAPTHPAGRPEPPHATVTAVTEGTPVFDQPGIGLDRDLEWIHRDQYVYFIEIARALGNPDDWASFRADLADALSAAFSLERTPPWADRRSTEDLKTRQRVLDVLDSIRFRHHPARSMHSSPRV